MHTLQASINECLQRIVNTHWPNKIITSITISILLLSDFYDSSTFANTFQEMQQSQLLSGGPFWTRHNWGYVQRNSRHKKRRELL